MDERQVNNARYNGWALALGLGAVILVPAVCGSPPEAAGTGAIIWELRDARTVGGHAATVLGAPREQTHAPGIEFNGKDDGLIVPVDPIAGWTTFTIEALIRPAADGAPAQRFLHIEDEHGNRATMEIRLNADGRWALDTFLLSDDHRQALLDRARLHPAGRWTWAALRYDGRRMTAFVDGVEELGATVRVAPFVAGRTALGVRLNRVYWFKGDIREVRFEAHALAAAELRRAP